MQRVGVDRKVGDSQIPSINTREVGNLKLLSTFNDIEYSWLILASSPGGLRDERQRHSNFSVHPNLLEGLVKCRLPEFLTQQAEVGP